MSSFPHGLFARQAPSEPVARTAVQKLLSFWTAPSLVALSPCLRNDPTAGAVGSAPNCHRTMIVCPSLSEETDNGAVVRLPRPQFSDAVWFRHGPTGRQVHRSPQPAPQDGRV